MNADQLIGYFERIAEAPDAVSRLRSFILDLAVRGKLVEQNLSDESAVQLLKHIKCERQHVLNEDRNHEPLPSIQVDVAPEN